MVKMFNRDEIAMLCLRAKARDLKLMGARKTIFQVE
jgi:hypothetical protein